METTDSNRTAVRRAEPLWAWQIGWCGMWLAAWAGFYYLCWWGFSEVPEWESAAVIWISGMLCFLSTFIALCFLVAVRLPFRYSIAFLVLCMGVNIGINQLLRQETYLLRIPAPHLYLGINLTLIGIALCGGNLISRSFRKKTYIIPVILVAGIADIWSVTLGVTAQIIQSRTAMNHFLLSFPVIGKGVLPLIGCTDFLFATLFLSLSDRFGLSLMKTRLFLCASFIVVISAAFASGQGMPVLPVMGLFFVIAHYPNIKLVEAREKKDAIKGLVIVLLILVLLTLLRR